MWLQITPLDHPYKRSRNNPVQQSESCDCYSGGTRLDSPSSIIMKQPLPGAAVTVCKEIRVHRQQSLSIDQKLIQSFALFSMQNHQLQRGYCYGGKGGEANCRHFHTRWKSRKKIACPVLTKYSHWEILLCDLLFWFCRLHNYFKIDFSLPVYWLFLSTFFQSDINMSDSLILHMCVICMCNHIYQDACT